jgi:hypothetical protein
LPGHTQAGRNAVARQSNKRLQETPGYRIPAERFNARVASIGSTGSRSRTVLARKIDAQRVVPGRTGCSTPGKLCFGFVSNKVE